MKVRIFALAKELGIDAKELIKHCNDAGVNVKSSSALASISEEERDVVVAYVKQMRASEPAVQPDAPPVPVREVARELGKVRAIKAMTPRGRASRLQRGQVATDATSESQPGAATATIEASDNATAVGSEAASPSSSAGDVVTETIEPPLDVSDDTVERGSLQVGAAGETPSINGITRDDYIPASGTAESTIREMKPRSIASGSEAASGARSAPRAKEKTKPAFPYLAVPPSYKLPRSPKTEKEEAPAQKPDLKLTADFLEQQSPLAAHLRKHAEEKRRHQTDELSPDKEAEPASPPRGGLGLVEARQQRRERRKQARRLLDEEPESEVRMRSSRRRRQKRAAPVGLKTSALIELPVTVRGFCEAVGRPSGVVMKHLFDMGQMLTINDTLDEEAALEVGLELGVDIEFKRARDIEEELAELLEQAETEDGTVRRPPIITILGHVDHGKTSLLDKIREANVAAGEAGGITQHITAYQVESHGQKLTFVDTPGHAAFGEMRARGANVTDMVVLVVAANDGVMPQTVECISHAKAAGVPITVALNKTDLPDTNEEKVLSDLAAQGITAQEWGGDTEVIRTSAITGQGIDELLETLLLTAELHELKCTPDRPALGVCIESFRDEGRGALTWFIVQKGTLRVGDVVVCGPAYGRVRAMYNDRDEELEEAGPATPVIVTGLDDVAGAGDHFFVLPGLDPAREAAEACRQRGRTETLARRNRPRRLEDILDAVRQGKVEDLPLILKADSPGSLEALRSEIAKFDHPEVRVQIVHEGVGGVNESDVYLASASGAIIVAFYVIPEDRALTLAEKEGVEIRRYNIIYEVTDQIKRSLEGLLEPEKVQVVTGRVLVLQTFNISRYGRVAGCRVLSGTVERSHRVHVIRDQRILNDYGIASLRRVKDDVKEVREGMECGIRLDGFNDVKEGDLLESFRVDVVKRTLD